MEIGGCGHFCWVNSKRTACLPPSLSLHPPLKVHWQLFWSVTSGNSAAQTLPSAWHRSALLKAHLC